MGFRPDVAGAESAADDHARRMLPAVFALAPSHLSPYSLTSSNAGQRRGSSEVAARPQTPVCRPAVVAVIVSHSMTRDFDGAEPGQEGAVGEAAQDGRLAGGGEPGREFGIGATAGGREGVDGDTPVDAGNGRGMPGSRTTASPPLPHSRFRTAAGGAGQSRLRRA